MSAFSRVFYSANVCLLPSEQNNYKPLAVRHPALLALSAVMVSVKVLSLFLIALTPATAQLSTITANRIVQLTNAERVQAGQKALSVNPLLTAAAQDKANHLLEEDYFAHVSPSGVTPWFWIAKHGYSYQVAGENLAIDFFEAEDVVAAWLASPSHRDNMLHSSYNETGVAVATGEFQGGTSIVVVHMFGLPSGAAVAPAIDSTPQPSTTPSPTPSAPSPSPTPTPITPPADTTPPRIPRIAIGNAIQPIQTSLTLHIEGEPANTIHITVNGAPLTTTTLDHTGEATLLTSIEKAPDGTLELAAYATDAAGNTSNSSTPLSLAKDTTAPEFGREAVSIVLGPLSDSPVALISITDKSEADVLRLTQEDDNTEHAVDSPVLVPISKNPLTLALTDITGNASDTYELTLTPTIASQADKQFVAPPTQFRQDSRRLIAGIIGVLLILLTTTVLVHIRIQRPAAILHTSLAIILGFILLLW